MSEPVRLQKFLSAAGVASRRRSEELIAEGRVEVDDRIVSRLGTRIDPTVARVRVDGMRVIAPKEHTYVIANKPRGMVCTMHDDRGREDLRVLVSSYHQRLFHVGRLDTDTAGLLVLTDDGDLAHRMAHPSFEIVKTYIAVVSGSVGASTAKRLRAGIELEDGLAAADRFVVKDRVAGRSQVELDIQMGRNRIVRRMLAASGHPVLELTRTGFGPLRLSGLASGHTRAIGRDDLGRLFDSVGL